MKKSPELGMGRRAAFGFLHVLRVLFSAYLEVFRRLRVFRVEFRLG